MPTLPFAATRTCRRCGAPANPARNQFTLTRTPAYDSLLTGNLCEECFAAVQRLIEKPDTEVTRRIDTQS